ncbi:MAG: hypothetical protein DMD91_13465 [Candidatus Rokuibacteriota bacterium]|nr:MAG: hypothetical protein DMD91_13465 [Candidatus Rokubacteria bacterium]
MRVARDADHPAAPPPVAAIILLAEVVDFQRFRRPRELMAYLGLVPSEYSSGETQRRGALTKAGNTVTPGESWSRPPGTIGTDPPSAARWRTAARANPTRSSATRGGRNSACIAATGISSATASERRSPWRRSHANWWGSSGPP